MDKLISCKSDMKFVPESYILPLETRPGKLVFPIINELPTIDFENGNCDRSKIMDQIMKASEDYGIFQLINHGVSEKLMHEVLELANDLYELPPEEKDKLYSEDPKKSCRMFTSLNYNTEKVHYWRDIFVHHGHPVEENSQFWPQNPPQYREIVGRYSNEMWKISKWLMDVICEGLGLESGYLDKRLNPEHMIAMNHYPACPDPSLTLALPSHGDFNAITLLIHRNDPGLQVFRDGQWFDVKPIPHSYLVNIGYTLQVISNGKLNAVEHRVMTSKNISRTSVVSSIHPSPTADIEPAKELLSKCNPRRFKSVLYKDFTNTCLIDFRDGKVPLDGYDVSNNNL